MILVAKVIDIALMKNHSIYGQFFRNIYETFCKRQSTFRCNKLANLTNGVCRKLDYYYERNIWWSYTSLFKFQDKLQVIPSYLACEYIIILPKEDFPIDSQNIYMIIEFYYDDKYKTISYITAPTEVTRGLPYIYADYSKGYCPIIDKTEFEQEDSDDKKWEF